MADYMFWPNKKTCPKHRNQRCIGNFMSLCTTYIYKEHKKVKISIWLTTYVQYCGSHIQKSTREDTKNPRVLPYIDWLARMLIEGAAEIILYVLILYFFLF